MFVSSNSSHGFDHISNAVQPISLLIHLSFKYSCWLRWSDCAYFTTSIQWTRRICTGNPTQLCWENVSCIMHAECTPPFKYYLQKCTIESVKDSEVYANKWWWYRSVHTVLYTVMLWDLNTFLVPLWLKSFLHSNQFWQRNSWPLQTENHPLTCWCTLNSCHAQRKR